MDMIPGQDDEDNGKPTTISVKLGENEASQSAPSHTTEALSTKRLSLWMIAKSSLPPEVHESQNQTLIMSETFKLKKLFLSHLDIDVIEHFEMFNKATHIYLQHNNIRKLEGFDYMSELGFLSVFCNRISLIENVKHLELLYLDAHENYIESVQAEELPKTLLYLDLSGNPCTTKPDYEKSLLKELPYLTYLDGKRVTNEMRLQLGLEPCDHLDEEDEYEGTSELGEVAVEGREVVEDLPSAESILEHLPELRQLVPDMESSMSALETLTQDIVSRSRERVHNLEGENTSEKGELSTIPKNQS